MPAAVSTPVPANEATFAYRPSLDGLRSIAVYLVVLFHAGIPALAGGFVGVDLFFVLSGFLITSVLLKEFSTTGEIRLMRFYARRVRRLLPAAIAAIVGTSAALVVVSSGIARGGWIRDAQASLLYVSNWHFINEARDYFGDAIDQSPFLHFWSLSIEEQFYLFFPVLLLAFLTAARKGWPLPPVVGVATLAMASLAAQIIWSATDSTRAYYGTDSRLYQIAAGVLVALFFGSTSSHKTRFARALGALSPVGLVALVLIASDVTAPTPSVRGLAATMASVAIIVGLESSPGSITSRFLSSRPLVYLGKISYGTYLWHWPIIVVTLAVLQAGHKLVATIALLGATAIAGMSYQLLELPIREARWGRKRGWTVAFGVGTSVLIALLVVPPILGSSRKPVPLVGSEASGIFVGPATSTDLNSPVPDGFDRVQHNVVGVPGDSGMHCEDGPPEDCIVNRGSGPHLLLVGDSHAKRLVPAFLQLARDHDFTLSLSVLASCRWQVGLAPEDFREDDCYSMRDDLYGRLLQELEPDLVVIVNVGFEPVGVRDKSLEDLPIEELLARTTHDSTLKLLEVADEVLILEPLPVPGFHVLECLSAALTVGECAFTYGHRETPQDSLVGIYEAVYRGEARTDPRITSAPYDQLPCVTGSPCIPVEDGVSTMTDTHHLSPGHAVDKRDRLWALLEPVMLRLEAGS